MVLRALTALLLLAGAAAPAAAYPFQAAPAQRQVHINQQLIPAATVQQMEMALGAPIFDGSYWYDATSGAWGLWGGPAVGALLPGLTLGGPLPANCSGGGTGVFVNGREIHPTEVANLRAIAPIPPGRYALDAAWTFGPEAGGAWFNLRAIMAASQPAGGQGDFYHSDITGTTVSSSGGGGYIMFDDGSGVSW